MRWGNIAVYFADGPASHDAADVSGFSQVNSRGREGAKVGTLDLRRAYIRVDWQKSGGAMAGVGGWTA